MEPNINDTLETFISRLHLAFEWSLDGLRSLFGEDRKVRLDADFNKNIGELITSYNRGFSVNGSKFLSLEDSFKNILVFGQTGSGKSTSVLVPSALRAIGNSSICINDPSGELAEKTSGAFASAGYDVKYLNYTKPELGGYNPLKRAKTTADIQKISSLIVTNSMGKPTDPFWNLSAIACISVFIRIAYSQSPEFHTMANVLHLLHTFNSKPTVIDLIVVATGDESLIAEYTSFIGNDPKTRQNIISTVKAALQIFSDPEVALATSYDCVSFEDFRKKPTVLFVNNSVANMKYFGVITSIFFTQFFAEVLSRIPSKEELPILFMIDEASSMNLSSILPIAIANIRKARAGIMQIYQSYFQLISIYGTNEAKSIKENSYSVLYLPGQNIDTARELSVTLGTFEFEAENGAKKQRYLLAPEEVRELKEALLLCGNKRAIKIALSPYYSNSRFRSLAGLAQYYPPNQLPLDTAPLIDLR